MKHIGCALMAGLLLLFTVGCTKEPTKQKETVSAGSLSDQAVEELLTEHSLEIASRMLESDKKLYETVRILEWKRYPDLKALEKEGATPLETPLMEVFEKQAPDKVEFVHLILDLAYSEEAKEIGVDFITEGVQDGFLLINKDPKKPEILYAPNFR